MKDGNIFVVVGGAEDSGGLRIPDLRRHSPHQPKSWGGEGGGRGGEKHVK